LLVDPETSGTFFDRLKQVAAGVSRDEGARMPGQRKREQDPVELQQAVWEQALALAGLS